MQGFLEFFDVVFWFVLILLALSGLWFCVIVPIVYVVRDGMPLDEAVIRSLGEEVER